MSLSREVGASRKAQRSSLRAGSAEAQWSGTGEQALYAWGVDVIPGGGTGAGRMAMAMEYAHPFLGWLEVEEAPESRFLRKLPPPRPWWLQL